MATSQSTIDYLLDQLSSLPRVRALKMFGEYALYCDDKMTALVCDNRLFLKITPPGKAMVGQHYEEGPPYPGAKPWMVIGAEELDDGERLCELIRVTADVLPAPKPKKPKTVKTAKSPSKASKPSAPKKPSASKKASKPMKPDKPSKRKSAK